jgi:hypothetical protein
MSEALSPTKRDLQVEIKKLQVGPAQLPRGLNSNLHVVPELLLQLV